jgi:hypothetical protein
MRSELRIRSVALVSTALVAIAALLPVTAATRLQAQATALVMVMAASSPVTAVSRADLRRMYQGNATDTGHSGRFMPMNQPPNSASRVQFDREILQMDAEAIAQFWVDQRIRGRGEAPRAVPSAELAIRLVSRLPNAIAYVPQTSVNATVKVIPVDGRAALR